MIIAMPPSMAIRVLLLLAAGAGVLCALSQRRRGPRAHIYNGIDAPEIAPDASPDEVLDAAVEYTFPASDPVSIEGAYRDASRRESRS